VPAAGPDKQLCGAQRMNQPKGVLCTQRAGWGTTHPGVGRCKRHGGNTATHGTAAEREQARQACELFGLEMTDRDPAEVLLGEITRTRRSIVWHETEIAMAMAEHDEERRDKLMPGWTVERKHLADVTAKALHAGVARRALELAEDTAQQVVAVLFEFARLMGHDPKSPAVREAGRSALQLASGKAA
jgi:hypothetical protein